MSAVATAPIRCGGCERKFAWKPQLAGKRVTCKCGHVIHVTGPTASDGPPRRTPPSPAGPRPAVRPDPVAELDGLAALAADAERAAAALPIEVRDVAPLAVAAPAPRQAAGRNPLGYQRGPSAKERRQAAAHARALVDPVRDTYVPVALIVVGLGLYVGFYGFRFDLGPGAMSVVAVALSLVTVFKTALLVGAALVLAGPLGVGFGSLWSAVLKLAAIAVFTDGVTAWVDHAIGHLAGRGGGNGLFGFGMLGWPVSIGLYWGMMVYLFSMDVVDARVVVVCLGIFSRLIRAAILMCLMSGVLSLGGVNSQSAAAAGVGTSSAPAATGIHISALSDRVDNLKAGDFLVEGRQFIAQGHQAALSKTVDGWYAAGCPNVWFEMSGRDINGRRSEQGLIVQLPQAPSGRAKAYDVLKQYDAQMQLGASPDELKDTGESYLMAGLR